VPELPLPLLLLLRPRQSANSRSGLLLLPLLPAAVPKAPRLLAAAARLAASADIDSSSSDVYLPAKGEEGSCGDGTA
jgi:hypothetical protein